MAATATKSINPLKSVKKTALVLKPGAAVLKDGMDIAPYLDLTVDAKEVIFELDLPKLVTEWRKSFGIPEAEAKPPKHFSPYTQPAYQATKNLRSIDKSPLKIKISNFNRAVSIDGLKSTMTLGHFIHIETNINFASWNGENTLIAQEQNQELIAQIDECLMKLINPLLDNKTIEERNSQLIENELTWREYNETILLKPFSKLKRANPLLYELINPLKPGSAATEKFYLETKQLSTHMQNFSKLSEKEIIDEILFKGPAESDSEKRISEATLAFTKLPNVTKALNQFNPSDKASTIDVSTKRHQALRKFISLIKSQEIHPKYINKKLTTSDWKNIFSLISNSHYHYTPTFQNLMVNAILADKDAFNKVIEQSLSSAHTYYLNPNAQSRRRGLAFRTISSYLQKETEKKELLIEKIRLIEGDKLQDSIVVLQELGDFIKEDNKAFESKTAELIKSLSNYLKTKNLPYTYESLLRWNSEMDRKSKDYEATSVIQSFFPRPTYFGMRSRGKDIFGLDSEKLQEFNIDGISFKQTKDIAQLQEMLVKVQGLAFYRQTSLTYKQSKYFLLQNTDGKKIGLAVASFDGPMQIFHYKNAKLAELTAKKFTLSVYGKSLAEEELNSAAGGIE